MALREVGGYGAYLVSDQGEVWSTKSKRYLKPYADTYGHLMVRLYPGGTQMCVHRLVAEAFIGPLPAGQQTRHLDGDPTNNTVANLAYGSPRENQLDAVRHCRNRSANKTHCPQGHEYSPENTYIRPDRNGSGRMCRTCARAASARNQTKKAG